MKVVRKQNEYFNGLVSYNFVRGRVLTVIAIGILAILASSVATAQKGQVKFSLGKIQRTDVETFVAGLKRKRTRLKTAQKYIPYFKVPASRGEVICTFSATGQIDCESLSDPLKCPTAIEVWLPNASQPTSIPIDCEGPDAGGDCECEVEGGSE